MVASTSENSSDRKYGFTLKVGALQDGIAQDLLQLDRLLPFRVDLRARLYQSRSMRYSARRTARASPIDRLSGGCGKRSSRY
jgi:hypothetical protein